MFYSFPLTLLHWMRVDLDNMMMNGVINYITLHFS